MFLSSAVVGGGWAGLLIDKGVVDISRASNGGSGALIKQQQYMNSVHKVMAHSSRD